MILPDIVFLLGKSVASAAIDATINPGVLKPWVREIDGYVERNGKFSQFSVGYFPFSPPPAFWDYKCKKCWWWVVPNLCKIVEGNISPRGWCVVWVPAEGYKAFTWPVELAEGKW